MARKPRLHFPAAVYYVRLVGNGGQQVFLDDTDRTRFLLLLQEGIEKFGHKIYAYCLQRSDLQLVIEVAEVPLSRIMQQLGFRYTRWFNDSHHQGGHLFQGRYRALLIDPERYLLDLVRAVHLAPVHTGGETDPLRYPWSSHRAYCGREKVPWLATDRPLLQIEATGIRAQMKFHAYVNDGLPPVAAADYRRGAASDPRILGDEEFVRGVMKLARQKYAPQLKLEKVLRVLLAHYRVSEAELAAPGKNRHCAEARAYLAWLCQETGCITLTALGQRLGRDVSSLSSAVRRLQLKAKQDQQVSATYGQLLTRVRR